MQWQQRICLCLQGQHSFSPEPYNIFFFFFLSFICTGNTQQERAGRVLLLLNWAFVKKVIMNPSSHETASKHHIMNKSILLLVELFFLPIFLFQLMNIIHLVVIYLLMRYCGFINYLTIINLISCLVSHHQKGWWIFLVKERQLFTTFHTASSDALGGTTVILT